MLIDSHHPLLASWSITTRLGLGLMWPSQEKHQQRPITCFKWSNDSVQLGVQRGIECIGFEGFNQVRIEGSIGVSRGGPSISYPCARGGQYNLIWAMR